MDQQDFFRKLTFGVNLNKRKSESNNNPITTNIDEPPNKKNNIHAIGDTPPTIATFDELVKKYHVSAQLVENIKNCGYLIPTPIQQQAIPAMLKNKQILACAPTGSGKTASFLIPLIHHLSKPMNLGFRAVIVNPTRELARQTYRECKRLSEGFNLKIHVTAKLKDTVDKAHTDISHKFDVLITTPNRLITLLNEEPRIISLKSVEWLVIDESDKLFEAGARGFRDQLAVIYQACDSKNIKRAMFSATRTVEVTRWCKKNLSNLVRITVGHRNTTVSSVEQELIYAANEDGKLIGLRDIIRKGINPPVLIFLQSKERARDLYTELLYDGINVDVIHSDRTQLQRDNVVQAFREGKVWVLICTELMGRGIDFKGVNLVINYDFPLTAISYIHRIGRTGRAGRTGKAITFFTDDDTPYLRSIVNVMKESGCEVPEYLLQVKKPHKSKLRKLENQNPERGEIIAKPRRYNKNVTNGKSDKAKSNNNNNNNNNNKNRFEKSKHGKMQKTKESRSTRKVGSKNKSKTKIAGKVNKKSENQVQHEV